jgi:hypothetical protein
MKFSQILCYLSSPFFPWNKTVVQICSITNKYTQIMKATKIIKRKETLTMTFVSVHMSIMQRISRFQHNILCLENNFITDLTFLWLIITLCRNAQLTCKLCLHFMKLSHNWRFLFSPCFAWNKIIVYMIYLEGIYSIKMHITAFKNKMIFDKLSAHAFHSPSLHSLTLKQCR